MVFPFIFLTSLTTLFSGVNALYYVNNGVGTSSNTYVSSLNNDERENYRVYKYTTMDVDTSYTTFGNSSNDLYFYVNPSNPNEYLQQLRIGRGYNEDDRLCYVNLTFSASKMIDGWKSTIGGDGVEEYNNWNYVMYSVQYRNSLNNTLTIVSNFNTTYSSVTYKLTSDVTYENQGALPYWEEVTYTIAITNRASENYYTLGYYDGLDENDAWSLSNYLYGIVDLPVLYLRSMFGFDLFGGISLFSVITSLLTIAVIIWVVRKFIG